MNAYNEFTSQGMATIFRVEDTDEDLIVSGSNSAPKHELTKSKSLDLKKKPKSDPNK